MPWLVCAIPGRRTPLMFQNTYGSVQLLKPGLRCRLPSALRVQGSTRIAGIDSDPSSGGCAIFSMTGVVSVRRPRSD